MVTLQQYKGLLVGLALGDALCAPYEGGILERFVWGLIGKTRKGKIRFTDDTQMSLDLCHSLLQRGELDQDHLAISFAQGYRYSRGYGPSAAKILKNIRAGKDWRDLNTMMFPQGSYGNGAAMRSPVLALFYIGEISKLLEAVQKSAVITHAHPQAVEGAELICLSAHYALEKKEPTEILKKLIEHSKSLEYKDKLELSLSWIREGLFPEPKEVVLKLGNNISAVNSCVTSIYIALNFLSGSYAEIIGFIKRCSGDTDTIAAMAGAIWGAYNGVDKVDHPEMPRLESINEIEALAENIYQIVYE